MLCLDVVKLFDIMAVILDAHVKHNPEVGYEVTADDLAKADTTEGGDADREFHSDVGVGDGVGTESAKGCAGGVAEPGDAGEDCELGMGGGAEDDIVNGMAGKDESSQIRQRTSVVNAGGPEGNALDDFVGEGEYNHDKGGGERRQRMRQKGSL